MFLASQVVASNWITFTACNHYEVIHSFTLFLKYFSYVIDTLHQFHTVLTFIDAWIQLTLKFTDIGLTELKNV